MSDLFMGFACPVCNADVPKGEPHTEAHCTGNLQRRIWELERERNSALDQCTELHRRLATRDALLRECGEAIGRACQEDWDIFLPEDLYLLLQRIAGALGEGDKSEGQPLKRRGER